MAEFSDIDKKKIVTALEEAGVNQPCPRCNNPQFTMLNGYFNNSVQSDLINIKLGGPGVPTAALICDNCGFISQHALGILGLLNEDKESSKEVENE